MPESEFEKSMTTAYATHSRYVGHDLPGHPEHAGRIRAVWETLGQAGLTNRMQLIEPDKVSDEQILAVHSEQYLKMFDSVVDSEYGVQFDADTYALPESPEIARLSTGGVISVVDAVLNGQADNGLAVVRPPGHHATPQRPMGFCLLGNVAIAVRHAQNAFNLKRILIVDFDVHHGNGTQDVFYDDDSVLFISTHQYPFYPGTGRMDEIGVDRGKGYTVNIPLSGGQGDEAYTNIYEQIIWPVARRFQPEMIMVSAGFDGHWVDPLAGMRLSLTGYAHLTRELLRMSDELCDGKIVFVMEGGYDLTALGHGVRNIAHALLGDNEISDPLGQSRHNSSGIEALIANLRHLHNLD